MVKFKIEKVLIVFHLLMLLSLSVLALDYKFLPVENCTSSNSKVMKISECSNDEKVFNIAGEAFVSLEKAYVNVELFLWKFTTFVRVFKSDRFEWCALMANSPKSSRFLKALVNAIREASPNLLIKCPYFGRQDFHNVTVSRTFLNLIPVGLYKMTAKIDVVERGKVTLYFVGRFKLMQ